MALLCIKRSLGHLRRKRKEPKKRKKKVKRGEGSFGHHVSLVFLECLQTKNKGTIRGYEGECFFFAGDPSPNTSSSSCSSWVGSSVDVFASSPGVTSSNLRPGGRQQGKEKGRCQQAAAALTERGQAKQASHGAHKHTFRQGPCRRSSLCCFAGAEKCTACSLCAASSKQHKVNTSQP